MTDAELLVKIKRRLGMTTTANDLLLGDLLSDARRLACGYTRRAVLPDALDGALCEMTAAGYNLLGLEGAQSHSEGGVSDALDRLPAHIRAQLDAWRIARVG